MCVMRGAVKVNAVMRVCAWKYSFTTVLCVGIGPDLSRGPCKGSTKMKFLTLMNNNVIITAAAFRFDPLVPKIL